MTEKFSAVCCGLRMRRAWTEIGKRVNAGGRSSREAYQRLFGAINYSLLDANRHSQRREKGQHFAYDAESKKYGLRIAQDASRLASKLLRGPL